MGRGKANPVDAEVGQRIKLLRLNAGLSQTELGNRIGVTFQQVQKYERGQTRVGASRLSQIALSLNIPISEFFEPGKSTTKRRNLAQSPFELLSQPLALKLLQLFSELPNQSLRQSIVELVQNIKQSCPSAVTGERKSNPQRRSATSSRLR
jgi:transcriptional regulator with XRE-family HTH domain